MKSISTWQERSLVGLCRKGCRALRLFAVAAFVGACREDGGPVEPRPSDLPYAAEEVSFQSDGLTLRGTLYLPASPRPAAGVVIVNGSGPVDRDGIFRPAPTLLPPIYRRWADLLAREGIAVLRYDKRFLTHPGLDVRRLTQADQVRDVAAAVRHLRERAEVDDARVFILGHSEGASLAPVAAAIDGRVRGVAAVAALGFSIDSLLLEQLRADPDIAPDTIENIAHKFRLLRAGRLPADEDILGVGPVYWSEWIRYTQKADSVVLALDRPMWVAQGMADEALPGGTLARNVSFWTALAASGRRIEFRTYPGVTHNLFNKEDGRAAEVVIHDAAKWVSAH